MDLCYIFHDCVFWILYAMTICWGNRKSEPGTAANDKSHTKHVRETRDDVETEREFLIRTKRNVRIAPAHNRCDRVPAANWMARAV